MQFESKFNTLGHVSSFPAYSGTRIMMMPIILGLVDSIPREHSRYDLTLDQLFNMMDPKHNNKVGYLTIDEKLVAKGSTHRRAGLHVDGVYNGVCGSWGGGGGGWGSVGNGMITVASERGCIAYNQVFKGKAGDEGECEHLKEQCQDGTVFEKNTAYWVDGLCVHESLPMETDTYRQFIRLSMPSEAPWFEGYTENPLGIKPTGQILHRRNFMDI